MSPSAYDAIYAIVRQVPLGQVATYGQIARLANRPGQARLVGYALFRVDMDSDIPWHRVINAQGKISESPFRQGGDDLQRHRLEGEGIVFSAAGVIDLRRYQWRPDLDDRVLEHQELDDRDVDDRDRLRDRLRTEEIE